MQDELSGVIEWLSRIHLFRGIDEPRIRQAYALMEKVQVPAGTIIFRQHDDPDSFYFVFDGKVKISRFNPKERRFLPLGYLEEYDYFGQEVLETNWPRQVTAEADSDTTLLRLSTSDFISMSRIIPELSQRLQMVLDSYKLMLNTRFIWQDPEEMIYFISRRHVLFMMQKILLPLVFGAIAVPLATFFWLRAPTQITFTALLALVIAGTLGWLIWSYVDWTNDYFIVTNRRVVYLEKVVLLYDTRQEAPLSTVQSTSFTTSQAGRIFQYGDVAIRTYIGDIPFHGVPYPALVTALIQEQQTRTKIHEIYTRTNEIPQRIEQRIKKGPELPSYPRQKPPPEAPSPLRHFLATMFHTRYVENGIVIFRTHWSILIKRVWIPTLLIIGLVALVLASAANRFAVFPAAATFALGGLAGLVLFVWWFYQYLDWHNDIYQITPDQVVDIYKKPLGQENRQSAPLMNILSIEYKRLGLISLILNFGTVYIHVGDQTLTFDDVSKPSEVQRELFEMLAKKKHQEQQKAYEDNAHQMADWFAEYNRWSTRQNPPSQPSPPPRPGF
jgi:CRP-like cAMP-binding protein